MSDSAELDLAYAAGIIDGEGYIGISTTEPKGTKRSPCFNCMDPRLNHRRRGGKGVRVPSEEIALKREYAAEARVLNQRRAVS